jgi:hypothetical protein
MSLHCHLLTRIICRISKIESTYIGFEDLTSVVMKSSVFSHVTPYNMVPSSFWFLPYFYTLMMEVTFLSETLIDFQRTTRVVSQKTKHLNLHVTKVTKNKIMSSSRTKSHHFKVREVLLCLATKWTYATIVVDSHVTYALPRPACPLL